MSSHGHKRSRDEDEDKRRDYRDDRREEGRKHHKSSGAARWATVGSDSESGCSSESSASSDDDSYDRRKRERSHRKEKKNRKEKKDKHHKRKHKHKHKHGDRDRDRDRQKHRSSHAVNQNEFGKYGIIREDHFFQKQKEFESYMAEVKHIPSTHGLSRREVMDYFKCFIEDYNTATMPHEKYYNFEQWELRKYDEDKRRQSAADEGDDLLSVGSTSSALRDEELKRMEIKLQREASQRKEFNELKARMANTTDLREDMRRQEQLRGELQLAHRAGDAQAVARLEKLLRPDDRVEELRNKERILGAKGGWK